MRVLKLTYCLQFVVTCVSVAGSAAAQPLGQAAVPGLCAVCCYLCFSCSPCSCPTTGPSSCSWPTCSLLLPVFQLQSLQLPDHWAKQLFLAYVQFVVTCVSVAVPAAARPLGQAAVPGLRAVCCYLCFSCSPCSCPTTGPSSCSWPTCSLLLPVFQLQSLQLPDHWAKQLFLAYVQFVVTCVSVAVPAAARPLGQAAVPDLKAVCCYLCFSCSPCSCPTTGPSSCSWPTCSLLLPVFQLQSLQLPDHWAKQLFLA